MLGIFLDLETSGLDPAKHRILEVAFKLYDLNRERLVSTYSTLIRQPAAVWETADPESLDVNGLSANTNAAGKEESVVADEIIRLFQSTGIERGGAVFIGQNSSFDRGFFSQLVEVYRQEAYRWPYHWLDLASMYWAACHGKPSRRLSKNEIARDYGIAEESSPHRAMNGVDHLIQCYNAVMGTELPL